MRLFAGTPFDRPPRCERCGKLEENCACPPPSVEPQQLTARLSLQKRKKGKLVTLIHGLSSHQGELSELLTRLKDACGAGGALKEGVLEIQGNQLDRVREVLTKVGYRVKG